jgi:predicted NodU family carbamoyl transferase
VHFPHSLGIFYQALTQYLGFPHYGDEYKVMGLAPYGAPSCMDAMRRIVRLKNGFELDVEFFSSPQGADLLPMAVRSSAIRRFVLARARAAPGTTPEPGRLIARPSP